MSGESCTMSGESCRERLERAVECLERAGEENTQVPNIGAYRKLCVRMIPRTAPYQCTLRMRIGHVELRCQKLIVRALLKSTTVESSMKSEHNLYLACKDSPQRAFFF